MYVDLDPGFFLGIPEPRTIILKSFSIGVFFFGFYVQEFMWKGGGGLMNRLNIHNLSIVLLYFTRILIIVKSIYLNYHDYKGWLTWEIISELSMEGLVGSAVVNFSPNPNLGERYTLLILDKVQMYHKWLNQCHKKILCALQTRKCKWSIDL